MRRILAYCLVTLFFIAFLVGMALRSISGGPMSGSDSNYWLGTMILEVLCTSIGLSICVATAVDRQFVVRFRPLLRVSRAFMKSEATLLERIAWFAAGTIMVLLGIILALSTLIACPALRC